MLRDLWFTFIVALFGTVSLVPAAQGQVEHQKELSPNLPARAKVLGRIADGTPPPPQAPPPPRDFPELVVEHTLVRQLPDRKLTIHRVADPQLPTPPAPKKQEPLDLDKPEVQAWLAQMHQKYENDQATSRMVFLSATVYDHQRTFLRGSVTGMGRKAESFEAWSNIDFNHLSGFGSMEYKGIQYQLIMAIGNADSEKSRSLAAQHDLRSPFDYAPQISVVEPSYLFSDSDQAVKGESKNLLEGLHDLYRHQKSELIQAYEGREKSRKARALELIRNPPKPKDTVITYWRKPTRTRDQALEGGEEK